MAPPRRNRQPAPTAHAAIYLRVSSEEQKKTGLGIGDQRLRCIEELARRGYADHVEYIDEGISGTKSIEKREGLRHLLEDVQAGKVAIMATLDTSRIARGVSLIKAVADVLITHGVIFVSIKESYIDTSTAVGAMLFHNKIAIDQFESDITSERTRAALAERGRLHSYKAGRLPLGYQREPGQERITVDDQAAALVRMVFAARGHGMTMAAIADQMNTADCPAPRGRQWYASTIKTIIDNAPRYRGLVEHWPAIL